MVKICILNPNKVCDNCNECNICDLDRNKICDNCGKCLELEGIDIRAIKVDEIIQGNEQVPDLWEEEKDHTNEDDFVYEFIDDIKDLKDLIAEENEEYPGLFIKKK